MALIQNLSFALGEPFGSLALSGSFTHYDFYCLWLTELRLGKVWDKRIQNGVGSGADLRALKLHGLRAR